MRWLLFLCFLFLNHYMIHYLNPNLCKSNKIQKICQGEEYTAASISVVSLPTPVCMMVVSPFLFPCLPLEAIPTPSEYKDPFSSHRCDGERSVAAVIQQQAHQF